MSMARGSRMLRYINYRMRITLQDSRVLVGTFLAFDRHMNIVLGDTEEFRKIRTKRGSGLTEEREEKRALGLIILRGDSVVSLTIDGPPPPENDDKALPGGPGVAKLAAARGLPVAPIAAPIGLAGPVRGIGGIMQPPVQVAAAAIPRPLPPPPGVLGGLPGLPPGVPGGLPRPPMPGMPPGMMLGGLPPPRGPPGVPGMPPMPLPPGMMPPRAPPGMPLPPPPRP